MGLGIFRRVECDVESLNVAFDVLEVERSKTVVRTHERLVEYDFMQITWLIDRLGRMRLKIAFDILIRIQHFKSCIRLVKSRMRLYKVRIRPSRAWENFTNLRAEINGH